MSKRSEFPKVSADPLQTIVDHGIPLHKFKNGSRRKFFVNHVGTP